MIDLDDVKTMLASVSGLGNWLLEIDTVLHVLISVASLAYIILKIKQLIEKGKQIMPYGKGTYGSNVGRPKKKKTTKKKGKKKNGH